MTDNRLGFGKKINMDTTAHDHDDNRRIKTKRKDKLKGPDYFESSMILILLDLSALLKYLCIHSDRIYFHPLLDIRFC